MSRTPRRPAEPPLPPYGTNDTPPPEIEEPTDEEVAALVFEEAPTTALDVLREHRWLVVGALAIAALAVVLVWLSRPNFLEQPDPPRVGGDVRPFPIDPDAPMNMVFGLLGAQAPHPVPADQRLARYSY
ncbi:MAG: hypothetical protein JSW43_05425, partial [Gemmatimonadota bacterium]